ncbi:MAG: OadG family protein [Lachnospiraceae bacterium]|nr:OadG family protein [Lachnospiraceae bacterium]
MKKIKTLSLALGLSMMLMFAGCGKEVASATKDVINNNVGEIIGEIVISPDTGYYTADERTAMIEMSEDDYEIKAELWSEDNLKFADQKTFTAAVNSFVKAEEEAGKASKVSADITVKEKKAGYTATAVMAFEQRNVNMNISYDSDMVITDITFSPVYSTGEAMTKAALNTLLGMGSVFSVLVLIMIIIYAFGIIPKIQNAVAKKKAMKNSQNTENSVDKTIAQIAEKEENELVDDYELVAVISAAIAAYEGNSGTDGFVVRSIKKSQSKKWQNAQY